MREADPTWNEWCLGHLLEVYTLPENNAVPIAGGSLPVDVHSSTPK